ncbi:hypothetical protein LUW77_30645 [Streptomyces radiopugnans]|nr:hypothetical protein LUW77_30645 [Streptomyces radiopugnans]
MDGPLPVPAAVAAPGEADGAESGQRRAPVLQRLLAVQRGPFQGHVLGEGGRGRQFGAL